jgi:hypothetical protein
MSLSHIPAGLNSESALRENLRALPLAAPSASAWPALEAALRANGIVATPAPRRHWRWAVPAALAAGLALALLLPRMAHTPTSSSPAAIATSTPAQSAPKPTTTNLLAANSAPDLDALRARSQRLETWLQRVAAGGTTLDGQNLMAAAEVEDLIGLVDVQLSGAGDSPEAAALWRQRIALLEDLGAIRTAAWGASANGLAINDGAARAVPANWIN